MDSGSSSRPRTKGDSDSMSTIEQPEQPEPEPELEDTEQPEPEQDPEQPEQPEPEQDPEPDPDTFPREYVDKLRSEAAGHRKAARQAQAEVSDLEAEVWRLRVASTGRLADPADLPIPEDRLEADVDAEVTRLLEARPHLAARRASGRVGQGEPSRAAAPSLADMLRAGA